MLPKYGGGGHLFFGPLQAKLLGESRPPRPPPGIYAYDAVAVN